MKKEDLIVDILLAVAEKGGVENVVAMTSAYLNQHGFRVRVVQLVWEKVSWLDENIEFYPLLEGREGHTLEEFIECYARFLGDHEKPQFILATAWPIMTAVARQASAQCKCPCKIISWTHAPIERYVAAGYGGAECLKHADVNFVLSNRAAQVIEKFREDNRAVVVYNPVDFERCLKKRDDNADSHVLIYIGRLSVEKRVDVILRALGRTQNWKLLVIGDGDERKNLVRLSRELGVLRRVEFLGWKENPWECASKATALVLASEYEGLPLAAIEALASGIPVISTPVDGIVELVKPGENGYLFPREDDKTLAEILTLMEARKLPPICPEVCKASVKAYEKKNALQKFRTELLNTRDTISIIIPCYNVKHRISICLDSILGQTIKGVRLEVICVDDCSTDNTLQVLQRYEAKYPEQIILIPLEENGKQGRARNIGLSYASGSLISFVDADDSIATEMLEKMYEQMVLHPCDYVECDFQRVENETDIEKECSGETEYINMENEEERRRYLLNNGWKTGACGRLYQHKFLEKHDIRFAETGYMEDIYFSELCFLYCKRCIRLPQRYYLYYINPDGTMLNKQISEYFLDTVRVQNMVTEYAREQQLIGKSESEYEYLHFSKAFAEPIARMQREEVPFDMEIVEQLKKMLLWYFPDILENPYIKLDESREMEFYKEILSAG